MKRDKYKCDYLQICPAFMKCRVAGVFTRKDTIYCTCRDLIKSLKMYNGKKIE